MFRQMVESFLNLNSSYMIVSGFAYIPNLIIVFIQQTTQWSRENKQKNKQRSTRHTYKTKDRVTRTPLKLGVKSGLPEG
jgi:hypothetical protein